MDKNKLSQIFTIITVGVMVALVGTVAVTKIAKNKPTTEAPSTSETLQQTVESATAPTTTRETVPMGGNNVVTTVTGQKPQWKIEEEASISASIAQSKAKTTTKNPSKTTKPSDGIVPNGRANIISAYEKGINNLKKTKKMTVIEESRYDVTVNDITGGYLVKQTTESLISQFMATTPKVYTFKNGVEPSGNLTPDDIIPPFNKTLRIKDDAIYSASAKATADGGYTLTIRLKDERQSITVSAKNHEEITFPIRLDELFSMGMVIEDYELTYNGTTITALFDKNNRIVYLEHFVSAPEATGNGTFSMVPFDINLTCNYIAKYDISY